MILLADELGETRVFWGRNLQFFSYDYRMGATLQVVGEHGYFYVENANVLSTVVDNVNEVIYVGTAHGGVFKRGFSDASWTSISLSPYTGFPKDATRKGYAAVNALVLNTSGTVIAGTDGGIYSLDPSATSWSSRGVSRAIFDLFIDGNNAYAATGGYIWSDDEDDDGDIDVDMGVRLSTDGGMTWSDVSTGLPADEDGQTVEVLSLVKSGTKVFAATPSGLFELEDGSNYWRATERELTLSSANVGVKLSESSRDEAQLGGESFRSYYRWLTVTAGDVSPETRVVVTLSPSIAGDADTLSQWVCKLQKGILGDEGNYLIELSAGTGYHNVPGLFAQYDSFSLSDIRYLDDDRTATIINPQMEVLLLAQDAADPDYEIGGQYATVTYENGSDVFQWSVRISSLREPNKDKKGLLLSNKNLIAGGSPNYVELNRPEQLQYFSATTISSDLSFTTMAVSAVEDTIIYGVTDLGVFSSGDGGSTWTQIGDNLDVTVYEIYVDEVIHLGTASGVYYYSSAENAWKQLPDDPENWVLPYIPTPIRTLSEVNGSLYAGGDLGCYSFSGIDSAWVSDNIKLYSYITEAELDTLKKMMDSTTPIDPTTGIHGILTENFGENRFPDIDNSDIITVLVHNIHDRSEPWTRTSNGSQGGIDPIHGYIRFDDQSLIGRTNRRDMVYIDTKESTIERQGAALAHQLMLLMMLNSDFDEERWITEGIAFFGEKLCGFDMPAVWVDFAQASTASGAISLVSGTPLVLWGVNPDGGSAVAELYTKVAMWMTYLYENLGGIEFVKALMDETANGIEGIDAVIPSHKPSGVGELSFADLFTAWSIANAVNDSSMVDGTTKLRYGYVDSAYASVVNKFKGGNSDSIGVKTIPLQPDESVTNYQKIQLPSAFSEGLNNWSTVYRAFFHLTATGGPKAWAGKTYHFNGADDKTFGVWLLKHKTAGGFIVKPLSSALDDENELQFNVLDEFNPINADSTEYEFDKVLVGLSNQSPLGGSAKYVQTTDVEPPGVDIGIVHHAFFPEFLSIYVYTDEHLHADIDQAENPVVFVSELLDTNRIDMALFQDLADSTGKYSGTLYSGKLQLKKDQTLNLFLAAVQDLAGNDTTYPSQSISVESITNPHESLFLVSNDHRFSVSVPGNALRVNSFITLFSESPVLYCELNGIDPTVLGDVEGMYTIGPSGLSLAQEEGYISFEVHKDETHDNIGVYTISGNQLVSVPSIYNPRNSIISASVRELGTYMIARNARVVPDVVLAPEEFELAQNFPNPFNPVTSIRYSLADPGKTTVVIYDLLGREVKKLVNAYQTPGQYSVRWNGTDNHGQKVGSGIYFYRMKARGHEDTKKMVFMK